MVVPSKGLGRGLNALFQNDIPLKDENNSQAERLANAKIIPMDNIVPNPNQPRKDFDQEALYDLADSIRIQGLLQPILVRPLPNDLPAQTASHYEIVAGERRWRAAKLAGLTELPVLIKELTEAQAAALALIENLQREDLNPMEEALGLQRLKDDFGLSQDDLAKQLGKSRSSVANSLRLLTLSENAQKNLRDGKISPGHARALLAFEDPAERESMRKQILDQKLSVREVEALAFEAKEKAAAAMQIETATEQQKPDSATEEELNTAANPLPEPPGYISGTLQDNISGNIAGNLSSTRENMAVLAAPPVQKEQGVPTQVPGKSKRSKKPQSATLRQLQQKLSQAVKLPVKISGRADKGKLSISYSSQAELAQLLAKLGVEGNLG
ncbi:MAG: ParB/RepB/Spo0J family partition protein [Deltaproteobacteria bacterium]|jgi:ParB family chromosome partitioning protein|nr:ParB/RepB/Spo0J family partition protein [Deltaproteobacteria bacterium]